MKRDDGQHPESDRVAAFRAYRERMNGRVMAADHLGIKRCFALDTAAYRDGALPGRVNELLGLTTSLVLRCNDCIDYHLDRCVEAGWSDDELNDALNIGLIVGGSVVISHLRHAAETIDLLWTEGTSDRSDRAKPVASRATVEPGHGG